MSRTAITTVAYGSGVDVEWAALTIPEKWILFWGLVGGGGRDAQRYGVTRGPRKAA